MATTLTINAFPLGVDNTQAQQVLYGTVTITGTYVTNGVPVNWNAMKNPDGSTFQPSIGPSTNDPIVVYFSSSIGGVQTVTPPGLQSYIYDSVHNSIRIYGGSTELANAAAITADTIVFEAHFARGV
jgi:hypothetical protein